MPSTVSAAVRAWIDHVGPGLLGVGCSGGADSLALADATIEEAGATNVVVIAIDHGLQAGSNAQAEAVATWARGQGAAALVERVAVIGRSEAAAREARYAAFERIADAVGLHKIFLGHTARDQAETVLMRIVRGTGIAGLAGIPAERGRFARPLLELSRDAIDAYVAARGLAPWDDPMNVDRAFHRVRVREDVMPRLRSDNPDIEGALVRLASHADETIRAIDSLAAGHAGLPIDCVALARQPAAIRKRALVLALGRDLDATHLEALDQLVTAPTRGEVSLDLPGARVVRSYDLLDIVRNPAVRDAGHECSCTYTHTCHVHVHVHVHDPIPSPHRTPPSGFLWRTYQPGDRMRPARLKGRSRKLSDLFVDAKVPRNLRSTARVLVREVDGAIVYAEHIGAAFDAPDDLVPR